MTVFQNSLGVWVLHDGSSYRYFQSEQEARQAMAAMNVSEQPLEIELAQTIVGELLPRLRELYKAMIALQVDWHDAQFQAALATAATNGTLLAGFPAAVWADWGQAFLYIQQALDAEVAALGGRSVEAVREARTSRGIPTARDRRRRG